jgi:hypothetical protein
MSLSRVAPAAAVMLGPLLFFLLLDPRLLDPSYFRWLLWQPDPATQFLGWHFFRLEAWHLPPGAARHYGMEMGGSIVFTDSIPLLALLFKLFRAALPDKFQYFGPWMLACYALQAWFAWLLSGVFTRIAVQRLAMTALFVLCPLLPDRAIGHYALMAHWLVLAALYLYLRAPDRHRRYHRVVAGDDVARGLLHDPGQRLFRRRRILRALRDQPECPVEPAMGLSFSAGPPGRRRNRV